MSHFKIEKKHEGCFIFGAPYGYSRRHDQRLIKFEVIKVKRKYADLRELGRMYETIHTRCLDKGISEECYRSGIRGSSDGYEWFETGEDYYEYCEHARKLDVTQSFFHNDYLRSYNKLSRDEMSAIHKIIEKYL